MLAAMCFLLQLAGCVLPPGIHVGRAFSGRGGSACGDGHDFVERNGECVDANAATAATEEQATDLSRACDYGNGRACVDLAGRLERGEGVRANPAGARQLRARACELEYAPGCEAPHAG